MRTRNIKLNIFLNEEEFKLLKGKSKKTKLTQSELIRNFITKKDEQDLSNIDVENITNIISSAINKLQNFRNEMYRLCYWNTVEILDKIIDELYKIYK